MNERSDLVKLQQYREQVFYPAYRKVFGVDGERTREQKIVWADIVEKALLQNSWIPSQQGNFDPYAAALNDGGRRYAVQIKSFVESKTKDPDEEQKKTKAKQ